MRRDERVQRGRYVARDLRSRQALERSDPVSQTETWFHALKICGWRAGRKIAQRRRAIARVGRDGDRGGIRLCEPTLENEGHVRVSDGMGKLRDAEFENAPVLLAGSVNKLEQRIVQHDLIADPIVVRVTDQAPGRPMERDVKWDDLRLAVRPEPHSRLAWESLSGATIAVRHVGVDRW